MAFISSYQDAVQRERGLNEDEIVWVWKLATVL
jgi:hypothetical protein